MPPKPGPPPRQVPRRRILLRRVLATGAVVVLVAGGIVLAYRATRGSGTPAPTTVAGPRVFRVVFPEGFTRKQMARRVQVVAGIAHNESGLHPRIGARTYLAATRPRVMRGFGRKRRRLEGFLFPSTYDFTAHTTSTLLVKAQLAAFRENWSQLDLRYARSKKLTPYNVLTIASLVEKEALAPDERPKIARVIYNRLHAHMNLGIDATTRYGLNVPPTKSLTASELNSANPYNTRNPNIVGLPPTPIANPGLASMQAAAHPAAGDWLYFVRTPDGVHHFFTASASAFNHYLAAHGYGPH
jgi:peptidoglycan lytic transglycosylase G